MNKKTYLIIFIIVLAGIVSYLFIRAPKNQDVVAPADELKYSNQTYGYTINFPQDWRGKYEVQENENSTAFLYTGYPELKESIFRIDVFSEEKWNVIQSEPGYSGTEIAKNNGLVFVYSMLLENPYAIDPAAGLEKYADEFQKMVGDVQTIIKTFEIKSGWKIYSNSTYNVSFKYPVSWQLKQGYDNRYEGGDGFFQLSAISGEGLTIDEVYKFEAYHKLQPYGSQPKIESLKIEGQEARLILPSDDQAGEMKNQAGLILQYPNSIQISGTKYYYFVLWADQNHIRKITETLRFIEVQSSDLLKASLFVRNYLDVYQDLNNKKNFDEVKSYIFEEQKKQMIDENMLLETNFTDFDRYEIIEISKSEDESFRKYVAKVKLYKNNAILQNPSGEIMKVHIIEENGKLKTPSWYFTQ